MRYLALVVLLESQWFSVSLSNQTDFLCDSVADFLDLLTLMNFCRGLVNPESLCFGPRLSEPSSAAGEFRIFDLGVSV